MERRERGAERLFVVLDAMRSGKAGGDGGDGGGGGGGGGGGRLLTQNRKFDCVARCQDIDRFITEFMF